MTTEPLTPNVSSRICSHMNNDHQDSLIDYASFYGGIKEPKEVKLIEINLITNTALFRLI